MYLSRDPSKHQDCGISGSSKSEIPEYEKLDSRSAQHPTKPSVSDSHTGAEFPLIRDVWSKSAWLWLLTHY